LIKTEGFVQSAIIRILRQLLLVWLDIIGVGSAIINGKRLGLGKKKNELLY